MLIVIMANTIYIPGKLYMSYRISFIVQTKTFLKSRVGILSAIV